MKLKGLRPMLWTRQLAETVDFYTQKLGFECAELNLEWGWASLFKDDVEVMLALPNEHMPFEKPTFTGSFYFDTDQVDELWVSLKNDVRVCYPIESFEHGMREFAIYDNNGYVLQFGQEISS
jgi:catechol 2,3-dioxygenase-like lactoylglutathione lyase family enzyme